MPRTANEVASVILDNKLYVFGNERMHLARARGPVVQLSTCVAGYEPNNNGSNFPAAHMYSCPPLLILLIRIVDIVVPGLCVPVPHQGGNSDGDSFVFDIGLNRWLEDGGGIPDRPHAGDHHSIVAGDGKIHLIGALGTRQARGKVQTLDISSNQWLVDPSPIPNGVHGSVCAARTDDGNIYVCGGLDGTNHRNPRDCYVYTPGASSPWRQIRSMIRGVDHAATGTDGVKVT